MPINKSQVEPKRIIITGGPSSGKTSIIKTLEQMGFDCMHEKSRDIIVESLAKKSDVLPWDNLMAFSQRVIQQRIAQYHLVAKNEQGGVTFYDRGVHDVLAYMDYDQIEIPTQFIEAAKQVNYYNLVFLAPAWEEIYENDNERREDFRKASDLMMHIEKCYRDFGYRVIKLPLASVDDRVNFILKTLGLSE